jgi:TPR repeat protein
MFTWFKRWKLNGLLKQLKKLQYARENGDSSAQQLEINKLIAVAEFFSREIFNKHFPQAKLQMFEYYRAAAGLNNAKAQYACALMCFDVGRFYESWHCSSYSHLAHERYMKEAYEQAFEFLNAAEANHSVDAVRYKGLAYIYGWGVAKDTSLGFNFVLESIEMADAWSSATKIIDQLHLNSPEFFQALTRYKAKTQEK